LSTESPNKTFCVYPFDYTVVRTTGMITPCCAMTTEQNISGQSVSDAWNSDFMHEIRHKMLAGKKVDECHRCYKTEADTGPSLRTTMWDQYQTKHIPLTDITRPRRFPRGIEIHLGNYCNLKCLTCCPRDSSMFAVEERKLKLLSPPTQHSNYQVITEINPDRIDQLIKDCQDHEITLLDLRGGEVTIMPQAKRILDTLPASLAKNITLRVQTNGQRIDAHWQDLWSKFHQVNVSVSVDAYGETNDYIRYPSRWHNLEENIQLLRSLPNVEVGITCTVSNLNLLRLAEFDAWARPLDVPYHTDGSGKYKITHTSYHFLHWPTLFQAQNLPAPLFDQARQQLMHVPELTKFFENSSNDAEWPQFCHTIDRRDAYRKNRIFDILPELKPYWTTR